MLIHRVELEGGMIADVRLAGGRIAAIGDLAAVAGEPVIAAAGGLLLPGLHDHHIHVAALAASLGSVRCGPPDVTDIAGLASALSTAGARGPGGGWLRGVGYHESVAGMLDAAMLDRLVPDRPLRIQHRGGRMWFFNSAGLDRILAGRAPPPGLDRAAGRLFDADAWLRAAPGNEPPSFASVGAILAAAGVTGLTDMSPGNAARIAAHFAAEHRRSALPQRVLLAGNLTLGPGDMADGLTLGPAKLHLHEADLPPFDQALGFIARAHATGRPVAVHCATEVELVFTLAAFADAGVQPGDRIEHASVTADGSIEEIARLGLSVCSQPHFIAERGDAYRADVAAEDQPLLYRLRAFLTAGVPLAGGSDAPFGRPDPWASMAAAVSRRTRDGATIGGKEALTPEEALDLYLRDPQALDRRRRIAPGEAADLCLLDRPWASARADLAGVRVAATLVGGRIVFDGVDQPPLQRGRRPDPPA